MEYGDFIISAKREDGGWIGDIRRKDGRHFTIKGTMPYALFGSAQTMPNFPTEAEAIAEAQLIADAAAIFNGR
jgi:hypothetical protein